MVTVSAMHHLSFLIVLILSFLTPLSLQLGLGGLAAANHQAMLDSANQQSSLARAQVRTLEEEVNGLLSRVAELEQENRTYMEENKRMSVENGNKSLQEVMNCDRADIWGILLLLCFTLFLSASPCL